MTTHQYNDAVWVLGADRGVQWRQRWVIDTSEALWGNSSVRQSTMYSVLRPALSTLYHNLYQSMIHRTRQPNRPAHPPSVLQLSADQSATLPPRTAQTTASTNRQQVSPLVTRCRGINNVSQKMCHLYFFAWFIKCWPTYKFISPTQPRIKSSINIPQHLNHITLYILAR